MRIVFLFLLGSVTFFLSSCGRDQRGALDNPDLRAYTHCTFSDGLEIVDEAPLAPGVRARTVDTAKGSKLIPMLSGLRIMFAYHETDFFANVKAEKLAAERYTESKQALIENFDYILKSSPPEEENLSLVAGMKKRDGRGLDRNKLEGGVLGIYLFFDDRTQVSTTVYLLNQEPLRRKFQTLEEYRTLRDRFIATYLSCIQDNLRH